MKAFPIILLFISVSAGAQLPLNEQQFLARLKTGSGMPEKILKTRTVVFYPYTMTVEEMEGIQKSFQRTGIDAVSYFESDLITTGRDGSVALAAYLNKREITNVILLRKDQFGFNIFITEFNHKANIVEQDQDTWQSQNKSLDALLQHIYLAATNSLKKENFLINEIPETGFSINAIDGRRNEFFAIDLKVDQLAVPKFGDEAMDKELEVIMKDYPYKYTLTEATLSESELRKQGFLFVLRFANARNKVVRNILGYEIPRGQSAVVSLTYSNDQQLLKNFSVNEVVYKFYFKHIESANVFLGTKWDADPSWQQALINQLKGYKVEFKLN